MQHVKISFLFLLLTMRQILKQFLNELLLRKLKMQGKVADFLGVSRFSINRCLKKYNSGSFFG
jgi:hypothetical protein